MSLLSCGGRSGKAKYAIDDDDYEKARQISKRIDEELKKEKEMYNKTYRLLVLGPGESGKSTFIKQMKILHDNGFTDEDRRSYIIHIRDNIKTAIKSIVGAMSILDPPIELADKNNQESLDFVLAQTRRSVFDDSTDEFVEHVLKLWNDAGVKECFRRSSEYLLYDSAEYFLNKVNAVYDPKYLPTNQDILRCRKITTGIFETKFTLKGVCFHFFDVGGQREERRKWIQCFNDATVILYVASSSCYDMLLREDETQNQLTESTELLTSLWNNRWLRYLSVILFLNKEDQLRQKIAAIGTTSLAKHHPEFTDFKFSSSKLTDLERAEEFILHKFKAAVYEGSHRESNAGYRHIYPHFTTAVDTENIRRVFDDTRNIIRRIVLDEMAGKKDSFDSDRWIDRNIGRQRAGSGSSTSTPSALT